MYREFVRLHQDESFDFSGVVTFNLDEFLGPVSLIVEPFRSFAEHTSRETHGCTRFHLDPTFALAEQFNIHFSVSTLGGPRDIESCH